jgi:Sulfotransferase family
MLIERIPRIIFVHIPKAAGTSLLRAVEEKVGQENVLTDYHRPMAKPEWQRNAQCLLASYYTRTQPGKIVSGHFLAGKYGRFTGLRFRKRPGLRYAVFFREPLQRAISHYYYWKRTENGGHKVWERFMRESWSLERFLLGHEHVNFQSKFVWRFPLEQFDFIGLADHFQSSLEMMGHTFPILKDLQVMSVNANTDKSMESAYAVDPELERKFRSLNEQDYVLYGRAREMFFRARSQCLTDDRFE